MAEKFTPDIVLIDCIESIHPETVSKLRTKNKNVKIIGIFSDAISNFGRGYFFAADYDSLFFKDKLIVDRLRSKLGMSYVYYLPQACDRYLHKHVSLTNDEREFYSCDITLAGSTYLYRAEAMKPLIGRNVKIWGHYPPPWSRHPSNVFCTGRFVTGNEKCKAMLASKIVLNINHYAEIDGTNKRTLEVAAIGAFQMTDTPAINDIFLPDKEVACFQSQKDMLDKIEFYLENPEQRNKMAERARKRAYDEHTYEHRWVAHLMTIGLHPPNNFPVKPNSLKVKPIPYNS